MTAPTYPAARAASLAVRERFAECRSAALRRGEPQVAPEPDETTIEQIATVAFWASLRREEGRSPKISLAYLPPEMGGHVVTLGRRLPLEAGVLTRLAPAVERPGIHLGVWHQDGALYVWGSTRTLPHSCLVLEVVEPGLLVVKRRRGPEGGKFANVAVLRGDQVRLVDERGGDRPANAPLIASLLGFDQPNIWAERANVAVQLALSMRTHGHGGTLLIVPDGSDAWLKSMVQPITYPVTPPYTELAELLRREPVGERHAVWQDQVRHVTDAIAGLTAVDGATVITDRYELRAFGAKIARAPGREPVERLVLVEPVIGAPAVHLNPADLGGTRHLSAAQFVNDQRDALAMVASQDGRFTLFGWPSGEDTVFAFAVESLLM